MARTLQDLEEAAMELPETERIVLAEHLMASVPFDPEVERAWLAEGERRLLRMLSGEDRQLTLEEFLSDEE